MGAVCEKRNQLEEAKYWLKHAVALDAQSPIAHQFLGTIYLKLNDREKAEAEFAISKNLADVAAREKDKAYE